MSGASPDNRTWHLVGGTARRSRPSTRLVRVVRAQAPGAPAARGKGRHVREANVALLRGANVVQCGGSCRPWGGIRRYCLHSVAARFGHTRSFSAVTPGALVARTEKTRQVLLNTKLLSNQRTSAVTP